MLVVAILMKISCNKKQLEFSRGLPAILLTLSKTARVGPAPNGARPSWARLSGMAVVATTIAGFLLGLILAASPELHERLHHDSDDEHHECLATVLHVGGCENPSPVDPLSDFVAIRVEETHEAGRSFLVDSLYLRFRILEHAPPPGT